MLEKKLKQYDLENNTANNVLNHCFLYKIEFKTTLLYFHDLVVTMLFNSILTFSRDKDKQNTL